MLELYYLEEADSICSNRVLMTLSEKNITYQLYHFDASVNEQDRQQIDGSGLTTNIANF